MIPPLFCVVLRGSLSSLYRREREQTTEKAARPAALAETIFRHGFIPYYVVDAMAAPSESLRDM